MSAIGTSTTGRRLLIAVGTLVILVHAEAWGFYLLHDQEVPYFHCLYRTFLLVTTVNEPSSFPTLAPDRQRISDQYTMLVLLIGMGLVLYTVSTFAAWILEGDLRGGVRKRRVKRMLHRQRNHLIVCGGGRTGQLIMAELTTQAEPFVVIETELERVEELDRQGYIVLRGDATQDHVLEAAGVTRARGIIAALPGDKENLFVVVTARQLNPDVKIVARSIDPQSDRKLAHAGADVVVGTNEITANRMVSSMIRPHVVTFVDQLMRDPDSNHRVAEVVIESGSNLAGATLGDSRLGGRTDILVLAIQPSDGEGFVCNPDASTELTANTRLVVLGEIDQLPALRELARAN